MTKKELEAQLESIGLPVAYKRFKKPPSPPFITYLRTSSENISSDFKVHGKKPTYAIELYTNDEDPVTEAKVEAILENIDPDYTTDETYIDSEKLFEVRYEIEIIDRR